MEVGFEETTVEKICTNCGVTLDEFKSVFPNKNDLLDTLGELFDQKYSELMLEMNPHISHYDKLFYLNQELFSMIEEHVPPELLKFTYIQAANEGRHNILDPKRLYYQLITQIMREGQEVGEFKAEDSPQEMTEIYAELERGMIYNWCISGVKYSLKDNSRKLLPVYLKELVQ